MSDPEPIVSRLDRAAQLTTNRLNQIENHLRAYEERLETLLQTTGSLVSEVTSTARELDRTSEQLDHVIQTRLPNVNRNLDEVEGVIQQLEEELPNKQAFIDGMQALYYSGRKRLRVLEDELTWLTTPYIIQVFQTSLLIYSIPRSRRWVRNVRLGAYIAIVIFAFWVKWLFDP